ncbi:MAG TPA: YeeE/YedE family protein [Candidatus Yaniella excrementigallinarum]|nr:YeeE/YedE family protein [Candidatus Yaniella excrementigallinarum]
MILTGLVVGAVLGVVMQRGRFCVTGMIRDIFMQRSWRTFVALLIVISIHAVGLAALTSTGVISPEYSTFAPGAVVVGGFLFGLGIILAGGCASGTWYRSAEGLVGSWIALAMYALSAAMMKTGALAGFNDWMKSWDTGLTTLPEAFGISAWWFAIAISVLTIILVRHFQAQNAKAPQVARLGNRPAWKRPLSLYTAGALVGLLGVIAWPLSAASGRNSGLGITTPTANTLQYSVTGENSYIDWGVMLVLGLLVGAFIAAKVTGEFRIRVPDATTAVRSVAGGMLMGVGASLAGGCTVGNGMVETSLFSFQGWVALVFIAVGIGVGAKFWLKPAKPAKTTQATNRTSAPATPGNPAASFVGVQAVNMPSLDTTTARDLGDGYFALDSLGAVCPFPLLEAKDAIAELAPGQHLVIDFDCTQGTETIPQWAVDDGHEVTDFHETGEASWQITIQKGEPVKTSSARSSSSISS